jgi:asparagine synthase (glutamine-hydrolysing)
MLFELLTPRVFRTFLRSFLGQKSSPGYLDLSVLQAAGIEPVFKPTFAPQPEGFQRRLVEKLRNTLMGNGLAEQLRDNDRDSMRWSIESRVPFLTTEIAEFLLGLPESYLISLDGETKCIFRAAMRGIVPDEILDRRDKIGFQTPETDWLRQHPQVFREWMAHAPQISMLKPDQATAFVDDFLNGKEDNGPKVWRLLNYVRWHHLMNIQNPATMKMTSSS